MHLRTRCSVRYFVLILLAIAACTASASAASDQSAIATGDAQLLVKFRDGTPNAVAARALSNAGAREIRSLPVLGVRVLRVPANAARQAVVVLRRNTSVEYVEADTVLKPQEVLPEDPYFLDSGSWNLGGGAWGWYVTHTTQAWDVTKGDPSIVIAVLDTGLKPAGLVDFDGRLASSWNVLNNSTDATSNAGNHGTYVAGIAAMTLGNGVGNAGYCPMCRLMIVQVGTDSGESLSNLAAGLT